MLTRKSILLFLLVLGCVELTAQYPSLKSTRSITVDGYKPYIYVNPFSLRSNPASSGNNTANRSTRNYSPGPIPGQAKQPPRTVVLTQEQENELIDRRSKAFLATYRRKDIAYEAMLKCDFGLAKVYLDSLPDTWYHPQLAPLKFISSVEFPEERKYWAFADYSKEFKIYNEYFRPYPMKRTGTYSSVHLISPTDRTLHIRFDSTRFAEPHAYPEDVRLVIDLMMLRILTRNAGLSGRETAVQIMEEAIAWYSQRVANWESYDELRGLIYYLCGRKTMGAYLMAKAMRQYPERKEKIIRRLALELRIKGRDTLTEPLFDKLKQERIEGLGDLDRSYLNEFSFIHSYVDANQPAKGLELMREVEMDYFLTPSSDGDTTFMNRISPHYLEGMILLALKAGDSDMVRSLFKRKRNVAHYNLDREREGIDYQAKFLDTLMRDVYKDKPDSLKNFLDSEAARIKIRNLQEVVSYLAELPLASLIELNKCELLQECLKEDLLIFEPYHFDELNYEPYKYSSTPELAIETLQSLYKCGIQFRFGG